MKLEDILNLTEETTSANVAGGAYQKPIRDGAPIKRKFSFLSYADDSECLGCKIIKHYKSINFPKKHSSTCRMCGKKHKS